jgi:hypothetical protein
MTPTAFATLVRFYTKTNTTTFTDAQILQLANVFKDDIAAKISKDVDEDYFGMTFFTDLVADQREYQLPSTILGRIKYVEAKLNGTDWKRLNEFDITQYQKPTSEADILAQFAGKDPEFDIWDRSIYIYSDAAIADVDDGLKLWGTIFPADFTTLSSSTDMSSDPSVTSHGFPIEFHELLARIVSISWKTSQPRPIPLSAKEQTYEIDLERALINMKDRNLDRSYIATFEDSSGHEY